ncbi:hypothetical protein JOM56_008097 [Amanita muscaria]
MMWSTSSFSSTTTIYLFEVPQDALASFNGSLLLAIRDQFNKKGGAFATAAAHFSFPWLVRSFLTEPSDLPWQLRGTQYLQISIRCYLLVLSIFSVPFGAFQSSIRSSWSAIPNRRLFHSQHQSLCLHPILGIMLYVSCALVCLNKQ